MDLISGKSGSTKITIEVNQLASLIHHTKKDSLNQPFSDCTARFDGTREEGVLDHFIAALTTYKGFHQISDEDAVNGLSFLLTGVAKNCWDSQKLKRPTWIKTLQWLKATFNPSEPAYVIYQDIVNLKQPADVSLREFIKSKEKLFARLSFDNIEEMKLDMVYGQLLERYKYGVPRETVSNLNELLEKGEYMEHQWAEVQNEEQETNDTSSLAIIKKKKPRCTFCRNLGHTYLDCKKVIEKARILKLKDKTLNNCVNVLNYGCFTCKAPGKFSLRCKNCSTPEKKSD